MKKVLKGLVLLAALAAAFAVGRMSVSHQPQVCYIDYEEYKALIKEKKDFVLYIGRPSCKICAIVTSSVHKFAEYMEEDIYVFNLEEVRGTALYTEMKDTVGFYYVPCFKAYKDGVEIAHLNNPLKIEYFEEDADRITLLREMEERVYAFIDGALGNGPLITEEPEAKRTKEAP